MKNLEWTKLELDRSNWPENGQLSIAKVRNKKICIGKYADNFFALNNLCPHAGGSLANGKINENGFVICPNHRYEFDPKTGKNPSGQGFYCEHYSIMEENNYLFILLPKQNGTFAFLKKLFNN